MSNWNPGQPPGGGPPPGGGGYGGPPAGGPPGGYGGPPPGGFGGPPQGGPPPGGYGAPPGMGPQPYGMQPGYQGAAPTITQGSIGLGFLAGFFGGCIGLILVYAIAKGPDTKKGAAIGFGVQTVVGILIRALAR